MVQLAAWLVLCLAIAWLLRNRVAYAIAVAIVVWAAVPALGGHHLTGLSGSGIAFHPATWLVLLTFAVQLVTNPLAIARVLGRHYLVVLSVVVFIAGAFITSRFTASGGTRLLMDQIVAPFLLWLIVVAAGEGRREVLKVVRNAILLGVAFQSVMALLQLAFDDVLLYANDYAQLDWFTPEQFHQRWMGTADSPLVLSMAACVAAALALSVRLPVWRFTLVGLYASAAVITQSRTGVIVIGLVVVYAIIRSRMALWSRALASIAVAGIAFYLLGSTLVAGVAGRFANDTGSTNARVLAFRFVADHWTEFLLTGQGLISSYTIARNAGLETSLENSFLMYAIDTGFLLATLYFGTQVVIVARYGLAQLSVRGVTLAAGIGVLMQHSFSAVAFANQSGTLIWACLALVVVAWSLPLSNQPPVPLATSQRPRRHLRPTDAHPSGAQPADTDQPSVGAPAAVSAATSSGS